jgi:hypothetical protein
MLTDDDRDALRVQHENEALRHRLQTTQSRLDELLKSAKIWRAWWNGKGGPEVTNLVEKIDLISRLVAADPPTPWTNCPCEHPWLRHDVDEYRGDGTETCCVEGCDQTGCPGRGAR